MQESETFSVLGEKKYSKEFATQQLLPGKYVLSLEIVYPGAFAISSAQFQVVEKKSLASMLKPYLRHKTVFNSPLINDNDSFTWLFWVILAVIVLILAGVIVFLRIRYN